VEAQSFAQFMYPSFTAILNSQSLLGDGLPLFELFAAESHEVGLWCQLSFYQIGGYKFVLLCFFFWFFFWSRLAPSLIFAPFSSTHLAWMRSFPRVQLQRSPGMLHPFPRDLPTFFTFFSSSLPISVFLKKVLVVQARLRRLWGFPVFSQSGTVNKFSRRSTFPFSLAELGFRLFSGPCKRYTKNILRLSPSGRFSLESFRPSV